MFLHRRYIGFLHTAAVSLAGLAWSAFLDPKITGASFSCSKKAPTLLLLVVVDLGVPEEGLGRVSALANGKENGCSRLERSHEPCHRLPRSSSWS
jgi:hypothetical protein